MVAKSVLSWFLLLGLGMFCFAWAQADYDDLVKLIQSGVDDEVLLAYIESSPAPFDLTADEILNLKDLGVSSKVISEALRHGQAADSQKVIEPAPPAISPVAAPPVPAAQPLQPTVAPPPNDLNISYFYEALSPYGNWISVDGTWYWQPSAATLDADWAPYCSRGHWVYTDWGWEWSSGYTWGWAPFHYGRWLRHPARGWVWAPDRVWGPAWVSWRSSDDYFGWAPLPPRARYVEHKGFYSGATIASDDFEFGLSLQEYTFVPTTHFYDPHPWAYVAPRVALAGIYNRSTVLRKNYAYTDNRIINQGPSVEIVKRVSKKEITPITIVSDDLKQGQPIRRESIVQNRLVLYRPAITDATPRDPMAARTRLEKRGVQTQSIAATQTAPLRRQEVIASVAKRQQSAAASADQERQRLDKAASIETDKNKRATLQADAELQGMRAQRARQSAEKALQVKTTPAAPAKEAVSTPQARSAAPARQTTARTRQAVPKELESDIRSEAQTEQAKQSFTEEQVRRHYQSEAQNEQQAAPKGNDKRQKRDK
jgi:hypothetical protein